MCLENKVLVLVGHYTVKLLLTLSLISFIFQILVLAKSDSVDLQICLGLVSHSLLVVHFKWKYVLYFVDCLACSNFYLVF